MEDTVNTIENIINDIIKVEGGYVFDKNDSGGETNYGITVKVARENGYTGDMKLLPRQTAYDIYYKQYVVKPNFDKVFMVSAEIGTELIDTGVNMGTSVAGKFLQQSLNALNDNATKYPDVVVDGAIGKASISSLVSFLEQRGSEGRVVLLRALNSLQCSRYISIAQDNPKNERFLFGWIRARVAL